MNTDKAALVEKTLNLLEYPKIMEKASGYALSTEAAEIIKNSKPLFDESVNNEKEKVRLIFELKKSNADEPRNWLPSIGFLIPKIETEGTVLDLDEALAIGLFIERSIELVKWISKNKNWSFEYQSTEVKNVSAEIFKIIDKDGNLRDLPALRAIKKRIESLEKDLKAAISRYCGEEDYKRMLQSPLPSQRDGRTVIAVKSNYRGRIKGIVHESSSSGQTIFIEPLDIVEKNNDIILEKRNLDAEIQKIMRELTEKVSIYSKEVKDFYTEIIKLECIRTKASYSMAIKGCFTKNTSNNEALFLNQARHPLLKNPVPINIEMNGDTRTLIITGPNTGGKTVALKTLGLLCMMNQSALALPLEASSILPVFDGIYADIGDEQSIDQSLSTFSAHITNISAITKHAAEKSLILLDELGSGTDPEEGGAIAMAILDYLINKKSRMIITTHHGILKHYGYTRQGVENASVEFNIHTLSPTYKIIAGLPGESRAIDIAQANGLDGVIVDSARKYINEDKSDVSEMIKGLEQKQRELAGIERKSAVEQNQLKEEKRRADLKELQLRQKEAELKREYTGKLQVLLSESRKTLENLVREVKEGEITREKTLKVKEFLNELARNVDNESNALDNEEAAIRDQIHKLENPVNTEKNIFTEGMEVLAGKSKQSGVIIRVDKKNSAGTSWIVKVGSLKISFPEKDLIPAAQTKKKNTGNTATVSWSADISAANEAVYELTVRKMNLEEALEAVRRQLEAAMLSGLKTFAIIHGKGHGILRNGIHDYLRSSSAVAEFHFSRPEMGGYGRTEVVLH
ncbi:MAG: endonuclease MutS2 [Treponema sp.]|jgi:DNA mismatch repair protein MutS2|nr:endonuclease MutS2 [Treponema sp.]